MSWLHQSRNSALDWLAAHVDAFAPPGERFMSRNKPLLELLLLVVYVLRNQDGDEPLDSLSRLTSRLHAVAQTPSLRDRPVRDSNDLLLRAGLCAVLAYSGQRDPTLDSAVQRAVKADTLGQSERLPYHVMEEMTVLDWGGFEHGLPPITSLMAQSILARPLDALYFTERTAYELTHNVMFGLAMGERSVKEFESLDRNGLLQTLTDMLTRFEREGHWDLVGELLLCWDCLDLIHDYTYVGGWRRFLNHQDADGSVPGIRPPGAPERLDTGASNPADVENRFRDRYHTTLVLVLAATARTRRGRRTESTMTRALQPLRPTCLKRSPVQCDATWLVSLLDRDDRDRAAIIATSVLVGLTLTAALDATLKPMLERAAGQIRDTLACQTSLASVPAALTLTTFGILRGHGLDAPALTEFVEAIRRVLGGSSPSPSVRSAWFEGQVILAQLKLAPRPSPPARYALWSRLDSAIDDPRSADIAAIAQVAASCTGFGTVPPEQLTSRDRAGARCLEAFAVGALRRSDLRIGCALVRGAHSIQPLHSDRARSLAAYIAAHQREAGGYGASDEAVADPEACASLPELDLEVDVRLPVSLSVLWALAEVGTDFRLYKDPFFDADYTKHTTHR